jgi:putative glutamine amidotransferase
VTTVRRPLIGLPGRRKRIAEIGGFPTTLGDLHVDLYFADYARSVYKAGGMPVHLPIDADPIDWVHHLDGLVLTGGADVDPVRYGHDNTASTTEPERDEVEFSLYRSALADEIPILGICRGFQLINVDAGGTLHQHVPAHARYDLPPSAPSHGLSITRRSILGELYGDARPVNSLHHQTADEIGRDLRVTAVADDGTPEAVEVPDARVLAVQWHPEMMGHDDPTFGWIVDAARRRRPG